MEDGMSDSDVEILDAAPKKSRKRMPAPTSAENPGEEDPDSARVEESADDGDVSPPAPAAKKRRTTKSIAAATAHDEDDEDASAKGKRKVTRKEWKKPTTAAGFDYTLDFGTTDFRVHPELYRVGKGEQGVLLVQPYKSEILPHWRFKDAAAATESSSAIWRMFQQYLDANDFVGADMSRKFLQMGYTRARRYANHAGGKKYDGPVPDDKKGQSGAHGRAELPRTSQPDTSKVEAAAIFKQKWDDCRASAEYQRQKEAFNANHVKR
jgi:hypothetical protein